MLLNFHETQLLDLCFERDCIQTGTVAFDASFPVRPPSLLSFIIYLRTS